jgi:hypothetical protein
MGFRRSTWRTSSDRTNLTRKEVWNMILTIAMVLLVIAVVTCILEALVIGARGHALSVALGSLRRKTDQCEEALKTVEERILEVKQLERTLEQANADNTRLRHDIGELSNANTKMIAQLAEIEDHMPARGAGGRFAPKTTA